MPADETTETETAATQPEAPEVEVAPEAGTGADEPEALRLVQMTGPGRTAFMRGGACEASVWGRGGRYIVIGPDGRTPLTAGNHRSQRAALKAAGFSR